MPTPLRCRASFDYAQFYHLTFSSIDGLRLFRTDQHQRIFLQKCRQYLHPSFVFLAYSLLPNEAHFVVQTRDQQSVWKEIEFLPYQNRTRSMVAYLRHPDPENFHQMMLHQINRFLVSYVNSFNYLEERSGALFKRSFYRRQLTIKSQVEECILFVHTCAQRMGIHTDFRSHLHHSWHEILQRSSLWVDAHAVISFFENIDQFRESHQQYVKQM